MLKPCRVTKLKVFFLVLVYVFNFDLFEFSTAILEKLLLFKLLRFLWSKVSPTIYKQLLDELFAISGIIKVDISRFENTYRDLCYSGHHKNLMQWYSVSKRNNEKCVMLKKRINQPCPYFAVRKMPHYPWTWHCSWMCAMCAQSTDYSLIC